MHGYGYPPEQQPKRRPSSAALVTLRVVFVALTFLSCGLLAWAAMLRLAIVTRKQRDWWLLALVFALNVGLIAYLGSLPDEEEVMSDAQALITLTWMLVLFAGTVTYYLYAEIRHYGPYGGPQAVPYGYGAPHPGVAAQPAAGYGQQTLPVPPVTPTPSYGYPQTPPQRPAATAPSDPARPAAPQRLDQVRAELDELSDYLRKEGDGR
ncbi:hypothetical protein ACFY8O_26655 [Streptomyces argenteolus]|uniref:Integral membrane protein n=1 Tax=Streptomyces argenteolus TaxID=67274 RepID=A0ABW6XCM1_9ACTN